MTKINLLPPELQKSRNVRRWRNLAAAVQAALFLGACAAALLFARQSADVEGRAAALRAGPAAARPNAPAGPARMMETLPAGALRGLMEMPAAATLVRISFAHGEFSIIAETRDVAAIQLHLDILGRGLSGSGAVLARIAAEPGGAYVYELGIPLGAGD